MSAAPQPSLADQAHPKPLFFWIVVLLGTVMVGVYVFTGVMIWRYGTTTRDFGWEPARRHGQWYVGEVDPEGPAEGKLQAGDLILAINDDARIPRIDSSLVWSVTARQDTYILEVKRSAERLRFELQAVRRRRYGNLGQSLAPLTASLGFYLVGMMLGLLKPQDRLARRASLTLLVFASFLLFLSAQPLSEFFNFRERVFYCVFNLIHPLEFALAYHFYYLFPSSASRSRLWTGLQYLLYLWGGLIYVPRLLRDSLILRTDSAAIGFLLDHARMLRLMAPLYFELASALAICAVLVRNFLLVKEPDQHRRIKWIIYGSMVAILPSILYQLLRLFAPSSTLRPGANAAELLYLSVMVSAVMTVAVPIAIGYAVLKHRVFDIQIVIRRGLQHLFATQVLRVILALPLAGLVWTIIANRDLPLTAILGRNPLLLLLILAAGLSLTFRGQLTRWIDRRFFREAYNQ